MSDIHISVVSPVYRGEKMLSQLVDRVTRAVGTITDSYEIILVNDASPDASWDAIVRACTSDSRVKGINLSRNFGQHYAITAGLRYAKGNWVVVMDCDLQDRPEEITRLYTKAQEGWDAVLAQRTIRHDSYFKRLSSRLFYRFFSYLTDTSQDASIANFGIYNHKVVESILSMGDAMRFFPSQVQWVGFRKTCIPVDHSDREEGRSSYNLHSLIKLALDTMISFSDKPLRLTVKFGFVITFLSFVAALLYIVKWLTGGIVVLGYTSLIISVWLLSGVLISLIGIVGLYIGRIFEKVKDRPLYIVLETKNIEND